MGFLLDWMATEEWLKRHKPSWMGKFGLPRLKNLNFILLHCKSFFPHHSIVAAIWTELIFILLLLDTYLILFTLLGSVVIYGAKNMNYIDALFFAAGCSSQSGLNT